MRTLLSGLCAAAGLFAPAWLLHGQDWPQFAAGPRRLSAAGTEDAARVGWVRWALNEHAGQPASFPYSGGVVAANGVVFAVGKVGPGEVALAVDGATGAVRWAAPVPAPVLGSWS